MAFNLFGTKKKDATKEPKTAPKADVPTPDVPAADTAATPASSTITPGRAGGPSVLRRMHVSEKSSRGQAMGQYTFIVDPSARKPEIAKAVESRYGVQVASVKIVNLPSKTKRVGKYYGSRAGVTKAIVVLAKGQSIATA